MAIRQRGHCCLRQSKGSLLTKTVKGCCTGIPVYRITYLLKTRKVRARSPVNDGGGVALEFSVVAVRHCMWHDDAGNEPLVAAWQPFLAGPAMQ